MGEKPSPYNQLLQIVAEAQEEKGEGGCFAEIYREIKSLGGIAHIYGDKKTLKQLSQLVKRLPENQTDGTLLIAQNSLDTIRSNISCTF